MNELISQIDVTKLPDWLINPSFQTLQLILVVYGGLLWLSIIIWVTRDAIHRSNSLLFQVFAIIINIAFPVLGILLYLIIRPSKTTTERYYEELEHKLILESIESGEVTGADLEEIKLTKKPIKKTTRKPKAKKSSKK